MSAHIAMVRESTYFGYKGRELFYRYVLPAEPVGVVVILHGYGEHSGRYSHVLQAFADAGYAAFAPDHRGHGHSQHVFADIEGSMLLREDVHILTELARQKCSGLPAVIAGHSMGGMFALYQLLEYQGEFEAVVLSGPMVMMPEGISPLIKILAGAIAAVLPNLPIQHVDLTEVTRNMEMRAEDDKDPLQYHGKVRARTGSELLKAQTEVNRRLSEIALPLLVMHGGEDKIISTSAAEYVYDNCGSSDKTMKHWPGLYHEIFNEPEREEVFSYMFDWLKTRV